MNTTPLRRCLTLAAALVLLCGCAGAGDTDAPQDRENPDPTPVTIGLTYIPDVQFAPFYVAAEAGYFAAEGLEVDLRHHGASESLFGALEAGDEDVVVAGNDEILQAVSHGTDVRSIATLYQSYPVQIFVPDDSELRTVADLRGHSIGVPGPFGATWFGLNGYLEVAGVDPGEVQIEHVGFTLFNALTEDHVDAVAGFSTADLANFEAADFAVRGLGDPDELPLVGIGLGASNEWLDANGEAAAGVNRAVAAAIADIAADPAVAVEAASQYIPGTVSDADRDAMTRTAAHMRDLYGQPPYGVQDPQKWDQMSAFMAELDLTDNPVSPQDAYTTEFTQEQ